MVKLIACDLDDTLLNRCKLISPRTLSALNACRERGTCILFATARAVGDCGSVLRAFKPDGFVACGGAQAIINDQTVYSAAMSAGTTDGLLRDLRALGCSITAMSVDGRFLSNCPMGGDYRHYTFSDFANGVGGAYKITAKVERDEDAREMVRRNPGCDLFTFAGEMWRRYANPDAKKEKALLAALNALGISPDDAAAFGDDRNDIGMLRLCGCGVAMGNAIEEVRSAARYIAKDCDADGVGIWLEEHVLRA